MSRIAAFALIFASAPALVAAAPADAGWDEVARVSDGGCTLSVTGNGRFFRIAASGLEPGGKGRYLLGNGDMKPLDWRVRADGSGGFARYYLPFRWHRQGDAVTVALDGGGCSLGTAFVWRRTEVATR